MAENKNIYLLWYSEYNYGFEEKDVTEVIGVFESKEEAEKAKEKAIEMLKNKHEDDLEYDENEKIYLLYRNIEIDLFIEEIEIGSIKDTSLWL